MCCETGIKGLFSWWLFQRFANRGASDASVASWAKCILTIDYIQFTPTSLAGASDLPPKRLSLPIIAIQIRHRWAAVFSIDRHVFVLLIENVVVEYIIVASLFLKEVSVEVHMLLIRIDTDEVAPTLVLEHWFLNHGVIWTFYFCWGFNREGTSLMVSSTTSLPITTEAIQFLLEYFWEERTLNNSTILKTLTSLNRVRASIVDTCTETYRVIYVGGMAHRALVNTTVVIVWHLILYVLLHLFVL